MVKLWAEKEVRNLRRIALIEPKVPVQISTYSDEDIKAFKALNYKFNPGYNHEMVTE